MPLFPCGLATHPQWPMACGLVLAQLRAQMALPSHASAPTLGLLYLTEPYAPHAQAIIDHLSAALPEVADWAGATGVGICASGAEYINEPALCVMLCDVPMDQYRVFSGVAPLPGRRRFAAHTALVHADAQLPDASELITELADRTASGQVFGALVGGRRQPLQMAQPGHGNAPGQGGAGGVFQGGLSGVAWGEGVRLITRIAHGCQPVAPAHTLTDADGTVLLALDGEPALDVLLRDLHISLDDPQHAVGILRQTLLGLAPGATNASHPTERLAGDLADDVRVRRIIGVDPNRRGIAMAEVAQVGERVVFCARHAPTARAHLMRIGAEIREALEPETIVDDLPPALAGAARDAEGTPQAPGLRGAIYISCASRGGPHFGAPGAELNSLRHALGDVPLVGLFAAGEIAGRTLHRHTGVLTVFVDEAAP